ncbi:Uncharacterized protein OBRU01_04710 [Operophtera brumata]|uniref:DUF5614 domain-containing protein n=1 Tax=Operophtera brumata TaxID=104452 RepID=A0A0L7LNH0_OPEBR|nr:Uncharacterized protein OBRU01_04710 [Operophtera brumata]
MGDREELLSKLDERIKFGNELIAQLNDVQDIDGVPKLQRKIRQEVEFLKKLKTSGKVKWEHLSCSNLRHFEAMVECSRRPGVIAVSKVFHLDDSTKLLVDIVSDGGKSWTKVIARNPKSLSALSSGNASYGARSILDQAVDYVDGIEESLANKLKARGVVVKGEILPDFKHDLSFDDSSDANYNAAPLFASENASSGKE